MRGQPSWSIKASSGYAQRIMRTTVTLDDDVYLLLSEVMKTRSLGFKEALNEALRRGLTEPRRRPHRRRYRVKGFDTGAPLVPIDDVASALVLAEGDRFK